MRKLIERGDYKAVEVHILPYDDRTAHQGTGARGLADSRKEFLRGTQHFGGSCGDASAIEKYRQFWVGLGTSCISAVFGTV